MTVSRRTPLLRTAGRPAAVLAALACCTATAAEPHGAAAKGSRSAANIASIRPIFQRYCRDCHGDGADEGGLDLDRLTAGTDFAADRRAWLAVWRNVRAQTMPPSDQRQPSDEERRRIVDFVERTVLQLDPAHPDPGRTTLRRLNRVEYADTVRDLLGIEYDAVENFPADDTGYGFDVIGDVLSISPLLMEKYVEAAQEIASRAVVGKLDLVPSRTIDADEFRDVKTGERVAAALPFVEPHTLVHRSSVAQGGKYRVTVELRTLGSEGATAHTIDLTVKLDGRPIGEKLLGWDRRDVISLEMAAELDRGRHELTLQLRPKDPPRDGEKPLQMQLRRVVVRGPLDGPHEYPPQYRRIFFDGPPPVDAAERERYLRKILQHFADRAYRRPIDPPTLDRLVELAHTSIDAPRGTFEGGVAQALTALLCSPRFLFRAEGPPADGAATVDHSDAAAVPIDEYSLAARLSYFLWSTMPDEPLRQAAAAGSLRRDLHRHVARMLDDPRSEQLVRNFVGQWLQTRDVPTIAVDAQRALGIRDFDEAQRKFNPEIRRAIRDETEMMFSHLLHENRPLVELLTADYSFLNEPLARFYGIDGVRGRQMRRVELRPDDHRGGLLRQASFLLVTSNPARTSPVKRGLFIMENLLGTPAPPPPPDVPPLEQSLNTSARPTMRELMEIHRRDPLCASCHARMDPLGLALEQYNAVGLWRSDDHGKPIETAGRLVTGEPFADVGELSRVIAERRRTDFYRCTTEKLLTYALGRGVEYYDAPAVDRIVAALEQDGRLQTLVYGIVDAAPFQLRRSASAAAPAKSPAPSPQRSSP